MPRARDLNRRTPQERRVRLYTHSVIFMIVNAGLTAMNLVRNPDRLWFYWPLIGWGAGLVLHAWIVYLHRNDAAGRSTADSGVSDPVTNSET